MEQEKLHWTIRRESLPLNRRKMADLAELCGRYAAEKNPFLRLFSERSRFAEIDGERQARDRLVKEGYKNGNGL